MTLTLTSLIQGLGVVRFPGLKRDIRWRIQLASATGGLIPKNT